MLSLSLWVATASVYGQEKPATPKEQFEALRVEYERASNSGVALTDEERLKHIGLVYKHRHALALRFLELAEKHPNDSVALDALMQAVWQVNGTPWPIELVGEDAARSRALELIRRDHIRSARLGPLCQRVSAGFCQEYETFLRAVLTENPVKNVQALAHLSLAQFLYGRLGRLDLCNEQPELAREFAGLFGKAYLIDLQRQERAKVVIEVESLLERALANLGDQILPGGEPVAERARNQLFEIRNLSVGKEAPNIEGEDQEGKRFTLHDYRGKVVLLDFWSFA
jgi:AhpC/TSA family